MNSYRKNAITVGALFIIATVAGVLSVLILSPILNNPDYLINISANENQVVIGGLFELIMAVACAGIAIWLYPVLKKYNGALALGSVGFRIIESIFHLVCVISLLSLVTLSHEFVKAGASYTSYFQTLGTLLLAVRDWAAYVLGTITFILGAVMYYYVLYQSKLIPRWLSAWGLIGAPLYVATAFFAMFGGGSLSTNVNLLFYPLAVQEMVFAIWLIVKGFNPSAIASLSAKTDINKV